jgi:hypothetical protein
MPPCKLKIWVLKKTRHKLYMVVIFRLYSVSPKKYPYNNRIISIEGTFLGTHCISESLSNQTNYWKLNWLEHYNQLRYRQNLHDWINIDISSKALHQSYIIVKEYKPIILLIIRMKKFLNSDSLRAVNFFEMQCQKLKCSA